MAEMTLIKCTNCGKQIESLGETEVTCRYCGEKVVVKEDEEETDFMRRAQIFNLEDEIKSEKFQKKIGFILLGLTLGALLFLFFAVNTQPIFMVINAVLFLGCLGFSIVHHKKLDKLKSQKFDLAGGKLLGGY